MKKLNLFGQSSLEYIVLLTLVGVIVVIAFRPTGNNLLQRVHDSSKANYDTVTRVIAGENPTPIHGGWCEWVPPLGEACTLGKQRRRDCACPAPQFGGLHCSHGSNPNTAGDKLAMQACTSGGDICGYTDWSECAAPGCGEQGTRHEINCSCPGGCLPPSTQICIKVCPGVPSAAGL